MEIRLRKLGKEKAKNLDKDFDNLYEKYKQKAMKAGLNGEIKFIKEHGVIYFYVVIWNIEKKNTQDTGLVSVVSPKDSRVASIATSCAV